MEYNESAILEQIKKFYILIYIKKVGWKLNKESDTEELLQAFGTKEKILEWKDKGFKMYDSDYLMEYLEIQAVIFDKFKTFSNQKKCSQYINSICTQIRGLIKYKDKPMIDLIEKFANKYFIPFKSLLEYFDLFVDVEIDAPQVFLENLQMNNDKKLFKN